MGLSSCSNTIGSMGAHGHTAAALHLGAHSAGRASIPHEYVLKALYETTNPS